MPFDHQPTGPGWVDVLTTGPHGRPVRARVRRRLNATTPPAKETTVTDKKSDAKQDEAVPHAEWRAQQIKNATDPATGESIPEGVRAGDPAPVDPSVQTTRGSSAKK